MQASLSRAVVVAMFVAVCVNLQAGETKIRLTDVTDKTGVDFVHTDGSDGRHFIVEYVSGGLALFDYDNDGDVRRLLPQWGSRP